MDQFVVPLLSSSSSGNAGRGERRRGNGLPNVLLPSDLGTNEPSQPRLSSYPKTLIGGNERCFHDHWYSERRWLEYSELFDKCYCYPCRKFHHLVDNTNNNSRVTDSSFLKGGFNNWKAALDKTKGFTKHSTSVTHRKAMRAWVESENRTSSNTTIQNLVFQDRIENNRYYVKSIADCMKFLIMNELAFRGESGKETFKFDFAAAYNPSDNEVHMHEQAFGAGLFQNLFRFAISKDAKLAEICKSIPKNAQYTSKDIQNEVIQTFHDIVISKIKQRLDSADGPYFCLKADGTRDKSNTENFSIMIRFSFGGAPVEHLVGLLALKELNAPYITTQILEHLSSLGIDLDKLVCQCYDGTNVMSGEEGGVQGLIKQRLGRDIPYFHCYNHKIHLIVISALGCEPLAEHFFKINNALHNWFNRFEVSVNNENVFIKRTIEIRWESHYQVGKYIVQNEDDIMKALNDTANGDANYDVSITLEAIGIKALIQRNHFFIVGRFLTKILGILNPVNKELQSEQMAYPRAMELIISSQHALEDLRQDDEYFTTLLTSMRNDGSSRLHRPNVRFSDSIVLSTTGQRQNSDSEGPTQNNLKGKLIHILDTVVNELKRRFSEKNCDLMKAVDSLSPKSTSFLNFDTLKPLIDYLGVCADDVHNEILTAKRLLLNKLPTANNEKTASRASTILSEYKEAYPELHKVYAGGFTFGVSNASCENSFSALTRVYTPFRRSMTHTRKSNLIILAYEKDITGSITLDEFLTEFKKKPHHLMQ